MRYVKNDKLTDSRYFVRKCCLFMPMSRTTNVQNIYCLITNHLLREQETHKNQFIEINT